MQFSDAVESVRHSSHATLSRVTDLQDGARIAIEAKLVFVLVEKLKTEVDTIKVGCALSTYDVVTHRPSQESIMDDLHHILKWDTAMALSVDAMPVHVHLLDHKLDAIRWRAARNIADLRSGAGSTPHILSG